MRTTAWLSGMLLLLPLASPADEGQHRMTLTLTAGWRSASSVHLVLTGVLAPGNRPFKVRVTTVTPEGTSILLGSVGVVAVRPTMSEPRRLDSLRIDVTRPIKMLSLADEGEQRVTIDLQAVNGHNRPLTDLEWSVEAAMFEPIRHEAGE